MLPETEQNLAKLNGLVQIDMALRRPLPPHKAHALNCAARPALDIGLRPMTEATFSRLVVVTGFQLGALGPQGSA
jgi:hypothetical protein